MRFSRYGLDLLLTLLMQFWNIFQQLSRVISFTKHSTSVDASFLCAIVFLRVACSWGWVTSFPVPSSFRLSPLPFCHLSFFLTFVFVSPLFPFHPTFLFSSPLPLPWWFFWFSCSFLLSIVACVSFYIFLALLIHLPHFSYFQHLYVFPDFGYQRIFSWKLRSRVFNSPPLRLLLALYCLSFFQHPFCYFVAHHFMKHCNFRGRLSFAAFSYRTFSHTVRLEGQTKSQTKSPTKKWDEPCQANRTFCLSFSHKLYFFKIF